MKKILFLLFILLLAVNVNAEKAEDIKLNGFVNDYAEVLTAEQENYLASLLQTTYDNRTAQIAVVTVNSLEGRDIESFAFEVAEGKLGLEDKDNGLLILVSVEDRAYRFEVGRGLEPYLNDAKIGRIGRELLVPSLKEGDYYNGLSNSVNQINIILSGNEAKDDFYDDSLGTSFLIFQLIAFLIPIVFFVVVIYL